jgi:hypothetical protein
VDREVLLGGVTFGQICRRKPAGRNEPRALGHRSPCLFTPVPRAVWNLGSEQEQEQEEQGLSPGLSLRKKPERRGLSRMGVIMQAVTWGTSTDFGNGLAAWESR